MAYTVSGACFSVDCLGSFGSVKKLVQSSVKACDQFLGIVKARIDSEENYSRSLEKISAMDLEQHCSFESLRESMEQLRADTKHKYVQHLHLAENLRNDVYLPITELRKQLNKKEATLSSQYQTMSQEIKNLESIYGRRFASYEKSHRESFVAYSAFKESLSAGKTNTHPASPAPNTATAETPLTSRLTSPDPPSRTSSSAKTPQPTSSSSSFRLDISSFASSLSPSLSQFAEKTKSAELLSWVVSSAQAASIAAVSPSSVGGSKTVSTAGHRSNDLGEVATRALIRAEKHRRAARKAWLEYVVVCQRYVLKAQILHTKMQGMQESFILLLQDHMRKMIVFESSSLANQQYDIQMLFKVIESVDAQGDIFKWIDSNRSLVKAGGSCASVPLSLESQRPGSPAVATMGREKLTSLPWCADVFSPVALQHISQLPLPPRADDLTKIPPTRGLPVMNSEWVFEVCQLPLLRFVPPREEEQPECGGREVDMLSFDNIDDPLSQPLHAPITTTTTTTSTRSGNEDSLMQDSSGMELCQSAQVYETAEDVLESLLSMQTDMREFWSDIVEAFAPPNREEGGAEAEADTIVNGEMVPSGVDRLDNGHAAEEHGENGSDDENTTAAAVTMSADSPERGDYEALELPSGDNSAVADDIIKSWGLLDVVSGSESEAALTLPSLPKGFAAPAPPPDAMMLSLAQTGEHIGLGSMKMK